MQKNVLEYLDRTAQLYPNKMAFDDDKKRITFKELKQEADAIGSYLLTLKQSRKPVAVYLPKGCDCISAFMGIVSSGNFYCPIDAAMPVERINVILNVLNPVAVITNKKLLKKTEKFAYSGSYILFEEAKESEIMTEELWTVRWEQIDTDPLYVLFTSGSTGVPKGVLISHRSVIDYIDWVTETFDVTQKDTFGNQAPFYFDNSVLDIYCALKNGSSVYIIPKVKFAFPVDLLQYIEEKEINFIFWVPSMLCMIVNLNAFDVMKPQCLKKVLFAGEVMPNKHLNVWRKALPDALYANLYGPTEITVDCTYYIVDRKFSDDEPLPIGKICKNSRVIVLNESDKAVGIGEEGELCVAGAGLALGYYNNSEKTKIAFVQNPLNNLYPEVIYRTGDIVKYNEYDELIYISRKDFQIKHMGYRIELGEIETLLMGADGIENCVCIYNEEESKIIACYTGKLTEQNLLKKKMMEKLPSYMIPDEFILYDKFPYNANGKVDRLALKNTLKN